MSWTNLLAAGRSVVGLGEKPAYQAVERGSVPRFEKASAEADAGPSGPLKPVLSRNPFGAAPVPSERAVPAAKEPLLGLVAPKAAVPPKRSWFGWLIGGNRRRESGPLVQGELLLQNVRPLRNNLREDDVALVERRQPKLIWETPAAGAPPDDQGHAWNRLRGRQLDRLVVKPD